MVFEPRGEFDLLLPEHIESANRTDSGGWVTNPDYLLFDDLVLTQALQDEHRVLREVLRAAIGEENLLDMRALLLRLLWPAGFRKNVIEAVLELEQQLFGKAMDDAALLLDSLPPAELAESLVAGRIAGTGQQVLRWPMANWLFARDCFAVAADSVVLGHPRHRARYRDGLLARAIVRYHPLFAGADVIDVRLDANDQAFFEGGDLLLPSPSVALIGIGIRTNLLGAQRLAAALQARGFSRVLGVRLPLRRGAMHLDTIFTMLDGQTCLLFEQAFSDDAPEQERCEIIDFYDQERPLGSNLVEVLRAVGLDLTAIPCGGGDPIAARREQWTDGANAVCLGPGRALLYARNTKTLRALNEAGFEVLLPQEFIRNAALWMSGDKRFVVALTGFELSRGRGGPRCLTLPIARG